MSSIIRNALALSALAAVAVAQEIPGPAPKTDAPCADAVIVMARGNNAPYQDSRTFPFVDATCGKLRAQGKTCDFIEVVFDTMQNGDYCTQIRTGVTNGQQEIIDFNKKCPCTKLILNGFSQGAWIMGDILAGPGGCSQITTGLDRTTSPGNAGKFSWLYPLKSWTTLTKLFSRRCSRLGRCHAQGQPAIQRPRRCRS